MMMVSDRVMVKRNGKEIMGARMPQKWNLEVPVEIWEQAKVF